MGRERKGNSSSATAKRPRQPTKSRATKKPRSAHPPDQEDETTNETTGTYSISHLPLANMQAASTDADAVQSTTAAQIHYREIMALVRCDLWSTDADVLLRVLEQFAEYCEPETLEGESCRQALFQAGGHAVLVHRLEDKNFVQNKAVQAKGLEVLFHLSSSPEVIIENALLHMGAVQVAVSAMWRFPDDGDIQVFACVLVGNLTNSLPQWKEIVQQAAEVKQRHENDQQKQLSSLSVMENPETRNHSEGADNNEGGKEEEAGSLHEEEENGDENGRDKDASPLSATHLLVAVQEAQRRHFDNEKIQEAVAFMLQRCLSIAGSIMLEELIASAPHCVNGLLLAKQKYSNSPGIAERVKSFFQKLVSIADASSY